jgi:hypothetical protein
MQEYFYNYLLKKIPDSEKTDSMIEYMEYLRRQINSKKKFSSKPEHFTINQIFSFFPKGFEFHFDYENIEVVAYDKENTVSSKIIIPSSEVIFKITFTKIYAKLLELEAEITDLNKCEKIIEQLKDLAKDKFKVVQIVIEPCYRQLKDGIEPLLKDEGKELKEKLKNENSSSDINQNQNQNQNANINKNLDQNEAQNKSFNQNSINESGPRDGNVSLNNIPYQNYLNDINRNSSQSQKIINNANIGEVENNTRQQQQQEFLLINQRQNEPQVNVIQTRKDNVLKQQLLEQQQQQKLLNLKNKQHQKEQQMIGNQLSPEQRKKNLSQTHLTQNNQILQPAQQGQQLLIVQKQKKGKKQPVKYVKKAGVGNKSKVSQIPKPNEDNDKGPEDTLRTNKRFVGNENNGNSIYINTNNYNLPLMQRDYS